MFNEGVAKLNLIRLAEKIPTEAAAYEYLESLRWNGTPTCAHCGSERCYFLTPANGTSRTTRTGSQSERRVWKCGQCRRQFSVITNTVMHGTKIPIRTWVFVLFEMCTDKNGLAAREVERKYGLTPRSAWHMTQRIREAMARGGITTTFTGTVQVDEAFHGGKPQNRHKSDRRPRGAQTKKNIILSIVHNETKEVRSRVIPNITGNTLRKAIEEHVDPSRSVLHTDEYMAYWNVGWYFQAHETVNHSKDVYVRTAKSGRVVTTNAVEGYFSQLQRSLDGTHHAISAKHLERYLAEFDFRYSTCKISDEERMERLVGRVGGKRLEYRTLTGRAA